MSIGVRHLAKDEIRARLDDLAMLRITVFRDWPYLYDGDVEYERRYLRPYAESPGAVVVGAFDGKALVGASTGTPIGDHEEGVLEALEGLEIPPESVFYLAESVLLPPFHGRGIGHAFFDLRERHARDHGFRHAVFASVIRPADHPMRPPRARDLGPSGASAATPRSRARRRASPGVTWARRRRPQSRCRSGSAISRRRRRDMFLKLSAGKRI